LDPSRHLHAGLTSLFFCNNARSYSKFRQFHLHVDLRYRFHLIRILYHWCILFPRFRIAFSIDSYLSSFTLCSCSACFLFDTLAIHSHYTCTLYTLTVNITCIPISCQRNRRVDVWVPIIGGDLRNDLSYFFAACKSTNLLYPCLQPVWFYFNVTSHSLLSESVSVFDFCPDLLRAVLKGR
jgi:hypothetical protein